MLINGEHIQLIYIHNFVVPKIVRKEDRITEVTINMPCKTHFLSKMDLIGRKLPPFFTNYNLYHQLEKFHIVYQQY